MWTVECLPDPVSDVALTSSKGSSSTHSSIVLGRLPISQLLTDTSQQEAFQQGQRVARVALADLVARQVAHYSSATRTNHSSNNGNTATSTTVSSSQQQDGHCHQVTVEPLDKYLTSKSRRAKSRKPTNGNSYVPYILERSDVWCNETHLHVVVRVIVSSSPHTETNDPDDASYIMTDEKKTDTTNTIVMDEIIKNAATSFLSNCIIVNESISSSQHQQIIMQHVACAVVQNRLREKLKLDGNVAFVADGSILPRKSGASTLPMASPPAIPFEAPKDSPTRQSLTVEMGLLAKYLPQYDDTSSVTFTGLVVPAGITLICGGGYHGKSTLLRCIAAGVYDKVPGDGREYCVTVQDAVTVRAEDGRYVNKCNVSAFISNLPTLEACTAQAIDTREFSTREASGSTSQAANVSEAIEMGATALLVDEDVSAANFMARDGRMRALVMDESITPLLYRVNGMYTTHGISSVVVVGGVGDWLDVPNTVILLNKYVASDATKKAASVSYQFSYNHVQYAGRGVVHRLPWDKEGTPISRRLTDDYLDSCSGNTCVSLMEGGHVVSVHEEADDENTIMDDDDVGCIDMSRCEQLLGKKNQLYACGLCVAWILSAAKKNPTLGIVHLVNKLEQAMDEAGGLLPLFSFSNNTFQSLSSSMAWNHLVESVGFAYRPRRHEIFMAVTRMRGIGLEALPVIDDGSEAAALAEEERKKRELAELWNARRKK